MIHYEYRLSKGGTNLRQVCRVMVSLTSLLYDQVLAVTGLMKDMVRTTIVPQTVTLVKSNFRRQAYRFCRYCPLGIARPGQ